MVKVLWRKVEGVARSCGDRLILTITRSADLDPISYHPTNCFTSISNIIINFQMSSHCQDLALSTSINRDGFEPEKSGGLKKAKKILVTKIWISRGLLSSMGSILLGSRISKTPNPIPRFRISWLEVGMSPERTILIPQWSSWCLEKFSRRIINGKDKSQSKWICQAEQCIKSRDPPLASVLA